MKLVHFSDIHLGYRQYQRQTPTGINQREADIAAAFRKTIEKTIELQPDLVVIGGDVFHNVRPTNPAILHAYKQFSRLVEMLPDAIVVMVAGNHDLPRTTETGCLLALFQTLGIRVAVDKPERFTFRGGELSVLAVPHAMGPRPKLDPDPSARYNVLLIHDEVEGLIRRFGLPFERPVEELTLEEIGAERWNYVALGHYHRYYKVAPNAFYSGSLEYASTNIWGELEEEYDSKGRGKGFVEHDLETGAHEFHSLLPLARKVIDLPELSAAGLTAEEVSSAIRAVVDACEGGIDDQIVRLVVRDIERHILRDLDHRVIREYKRRALHFHLDTRRPELKRTEGSGAPGRRSSLAETVRAVLEKRALTPGIDRAALVELGLRYLADADRSAAISIDATE
ncbi:MAG TPA: DNA repair exonuclease [Gemmatimonadaceae bacterium]|jgi:DNA repair exonuclease SbcCD nuclease subunit